MSFTDNSRGRSQSPPGSRSTHQTLCLSAAAPPNALIFLRCPSVFPILIANLELEFRVSPIRITDLRFSNRKFFAISSFPTRATNRESQATEPLIENARLRSELSVNDSSRLQISNRERIGYPVPACSAEPARYRSHLRFSKPPMSNLQAARRIRDTCNDIPSLSAFPRCYASCGSRRKSE